jgi:signal recognition particle subunit SRP54
MISNMGPLGNLMSMVPGMSPEIAALSNTEGTKKLKRMMCIMDSMTTAELESDGRMFWVNTSPDPNRNTAVERVQRVAKGSGCHIREVEELFMQHRKFAEIVKKM